MSTLRPFEEPVLISEWLADPITVEVLESIFGRRDEPEWGRNARLHVRDDDGKMEKLHERDAAEWVVARLREKYP